MIDKININQIPDPRHTGDGSSADQQNRIKTVADNKADATLQIDYARLIEQATQGRMKMREVYGKTLLAATDILNKVMKQTTDSGSVVIKIAPGKLPLSSSLSATIDLNLGKILSRILIGDLISI